MREIGVLEGEQRVRLGEKDEGRRRWQLRAGCGVTPGLSHLGFGLLQDSW